MEIIQERLEREYNLDLITTAPSVVYRITKTDGEMMLDRQPHQLPRSRRRLQIGRGADCPTRTSITPTEYVGNIMELCQERRGVFKDMKYLDTDRVDMHYELPLNEIIYDFFDALKSRTRGYASFDYELTGYRASPIWSSWISCSTAKWWTRCPLSSTRTRPMPEPERSCEKLKENIPRQLFEVPIQAAIGGKIIARETVKAMRKDVLAKCYGGDITRKKKLLEKQKEGKKRMRSFGTVEVPQEAFMAVLKLDSE